MNPREQPREDFAPLNAKRICEICGAAVTNLNPLCTTCDPICTRAKHNGLTRPGQIKRDITDQQRDERMGFWRDRPEFIK